MNKNFMEFFYDFLAFHNFCNYIMIKNVLKKAFISIFIPTLKC